MQTDAEFGKRVPKYIWNESRCHAMDNEIHEARGMKPTRCGFKITSEASQKQTWAKVHFRLQQSLRKSQARTLIGMKSLTGNGRNQRRFQMDKVSIEIEL